MPATASPRYLSIRARASRSVGTGTAADASERTSTKTPAAATTIVVAASSAMWVRLISVREGVTGRGDAARRDVQRVGAARQAGRQGEVGRLRLARPAGDHRAEVEATGEVDVPGAVPQR